MEAANDHSRASQTPKTLLRIHNFRRLDRLDMMDLSEAEGTTIAAVKGAGASR